MGGIPAIKNGCFIIAIPTLYWECHRPNGRTHIFQRGRLNHQLDELLDEFTVVLILLTFVDENYEFMDDLIDGHIV